MCPGTRRGCVWGIDMDKSRGNTCRHVCGIDAGMSRDYTWACLRNRCGRVWGIDVVVSGE